VPGRGADVETVDLVTTQDLSWAHGAVHARIAFEGPRSPRASLGVLLASDDAPVAEHLHDGAWEVLAALSAAGRLHVPAQSVPGVSAPLEARDRTVTAGSIVYVPAGVRHGWVPDGTRPLIAVQVYAPAGPEQRFRGLAGR
jgi:mannose-6-phosphate isomerase-like protein (cupin superfamily)